VTGIFRQKTPANIFILLVFGGLIKLPLFLEPRIPVSKPQDTILYKSILDFLEESGKNMPVIYSGLAFGLLFLEAVLLTLFMNRQRMMSHSTWFPGMAYMIITSLVPEWNYFSAPLLLNVLMLLVLTGLFRTYNQPKASGSVFNIGLVLGVASFLFFPSLTFLIWTLLALAIMRPFSLKEWLLCILGATTPFYFYAVYLFVKGELNWENLWPYFSLSVPTVKQSAWLAGSVFLLALPFLAGGYYVQESLRRMLIQVRKGWSLLLLYLLGALFIPFVNSSEGFENWMVAAIPLAAFHACTYLYSTFRIFPLLLFWLSVAFIIGYQFYGPGWG
jgi:hypothetical protein